MESKEKAIISVQIEINASPEKVWKNWVNPEDIIGWNSASDDWHTTRAKNDLQVGGSFSYRMEAKDGSMGFDFEGVYEKVEINKQIDILLGDGRKLKVTFTDLGSGTRVSETFEAENENPAELQRTGWQTILDNFKKYTESN
jgi:uncharacterized protein YndB with AHSA1/START domain